jgi:CrcB protein
MADRLVPLLIALGGFLGAASRYAVGSVVAGPESTLAVNVVGSFVLGTTVSLVRSSRLRLFLTTGLLSSFTTYSTFVVEATALGVALGAANVAAQYTLGIAAAAAGMALGRRLA